MNAIIKLIKNSGVILSFILLVLYFVGFLTIQSYFCIYGVRLQMLDLTIIIAGISFFIFLSPHFLKFVFIYFLFKKYSKKKRLPGFFYIYWIFWSMVYYIFFVRYFNFSIFIIVKFFIFMIIINLPCILFVYRKAILGRRFCPSYIKIGLVLCVSIYYFFFYGILIWPQLSPVLGGGEPFSVRVILKDENINNTKYNSIFGDSTGLKKVKLFYNTPTSYIFQIDYKSKNKYMIEINKSDIHGLIYEH